MNASLENLSADQKRTLLAQLLAKKNAGAQRFALSHAQRRLWFMQQLQADSNAYHIPAAVRISGQLDATLLEKSLNTIIARHDVLRSRFVAEDGEPHVQIAPVAPFLLTVEKITDAGDIEQRLRTLVQPAFDLENGMPLRARLLRISDNEHVLLLCVHHIVADYWSLRVLLREIAAIYASSGNDVLPKLAIQYVDYAAWQHNQNDKLEQQLDYWRNQLSALPPPLALPLDHARLPVQRGAGQRLAFALDIQLSDQLRALARANNASLFVTLLAALQTLLFRYTGQDDFCVGSTISNRDRNETLDLIGLFVNNLVLRARIDAEQAFTTLLTQVRDTALGAFANQDLPFEQLVDALKVERRLDRHPLFHIMFVLHNTPPQNIELPGLTLSAIEADTLATRFDLALDMIDAGGCLHGAFEFSTDLFKPATIARLYTHFETLLRAIVKQPQCKIGDLDLLPPDQHALTLLAGPQQDIAKGGASELLVRAAAEHADAVAVVFADTQLTYRELHAQAAQLMHALRARGIESGDRVAICISRSTDLVVALVACLRLGVAYIPLDPRQPAARLAAMLEDARPALALIANDELNALLPFAALQCAVLDMEHERAALLQLADHAENALIDATTPAYVIFTSGTTGRPKGVAITQHALANLLQSMLQAPGLHAGDALLAVTTIGFDIAALELLLPLCCGARVVIADHDTVLDGNKLAAALTANNITHMQATPAGWRLLLDSGWQGKEDLTMLCGGEALDANLARQLLQRGVALWNMYGPTETTIWSAALRVTESSSGNLPIGGVIANTWFAIVDARGKPLPVGIAGELLIGGAGLAVGYHAQPALTAEKFVDININGTLQRAYRSGDRVRLRADGFIEFLGRVDHQIKLRGFRIEPADVEAALNAHAGVAQGVVGLWRESENAEPQLIGWYKPRESSDNEHLGRALRDHLTRQLPTYMVPAALVAVSEFALNANGKTDRRALPAPTFESNRTDARAPQGDTELKLAAIWSQLLPQAVSTAEDDFFALGGHSLLAARMLAQVRKAFDIELQLRAIFEYPTLAGFAAQLQQHMRSAPQTIITTADRSKPLLLSAAQQRQWILAQLEPDSPFYNIPAAVRVQGKLATALLQKSLALLCQRHEILRTQYSSADGQPMLQIMQSLQPAVESLDLSAAPADQRLSRAIELARNAAAKPFPLAQAPLLRVTALKLDTRDHVVLLVLHHILADAWSMTILLRELMQIYQALQQGLQPALPALPLQYVDYAAWQRSLDHGESLAYWRDKLAAAPVLLDLPTDFSRPVNQDFRGASVRFVLGASKRRALEQIARNNGATLFMVLLALFKWMLSRYSGMNDIVVGTPVGHRPHSDLDGVIGLFANTLALRTDIDAGDHFDKLLQRVRTTVLDGFAHQQVPFEQVLEALDVPRNWAHAPLFQVMLLWQSATQVVADQIVVDQVVADDNRWSPLPLDAGSAKFDLTLALAESADGIDGRIDYRCDLFRAETIASMAEVFCTLAAMVAANPSQPLSSLPLISNAQRLQLQQWNDTTSTFDTQQRLGDAFTQHAAQHPDTLALICGTERLTYCELDQRANGLALTLRKLGVGAEVRVGICLRRNADLIIGLLATLKAGGAYVPLDPAYPPARLALILEDAAPRVLLCHADGGNQQLAARAHADGIAVLYLDRDAHCNEVNSENRIAVSATAPQPLAGAANTAYIIYTSGSTGRPKGVTIEHRQATALLHWANKRFEPRQLKGTLVSTSICFDLSVFEIFVPLAVGGAIIVADDVLQLPELPAANEVTLINTVPTAAAALLRLGALPASINTVNVAGEPVPASLVRDLYAQANITQVYNLYGPSEDTTYSTEALLLRPDGSAAQPVPIGSPIANTRAHVLDENLQPVAIGMTGELFLGGAGVARGYWNRPALTAERFVPNPFADGINDTDTLLYRTGDRVRRRYDGQLDFLGRIDQQVKIRGFRIEIGDIEAALQNHGDVIEAVAGAWTDSNGNRRLAAWFVPAQPGTEDTARRLRTHLQATLPDFMVPAAFVELTALPLLPNGKIDRGNLPAPLAQSVEIRNQTSPTDVMEATLLDIWRGVLAYPTLRVDDNFFASGGDSILAIQTVARARQAGLRMMPRDLFQHATIAALAAHLRANGGGVVAEREAVTGAVPMTPIQQWFFSQQLQNPQHWNQSLLLDVAIALDEVLLQQALQVLAQHHDVLRARFEYRDNRWQQIYSQKLAAIPLRVIRRDCDDVAGCIHEHAETAQSSFDLATAPLWQLQYFDLATADGPQRRLLLVFHHLLIDGVSWRVLLDDLQTLYTQLASGQLVNDQSPQLPPRSSSCHDWVQWQQAGQSQFVSQLPYWQQQTATRSAPLPRDNANGSNRMRDAATVSLRLNSQETLQLLQTVPSLYRISVEELLLASVMLSVQAWAGNRCRQILLEGHGRDSDDNSIDLSRTCGWLTTLYPLRIDAFPVLDITTANADLVLRHIKSSVRSVPQQGLGYGVLRWLNDDIDVSASLVSDAEIRFNYLGQTDALFAGGGAFTPAVEAAGHARHPDDARDVLFDINAIVSRGELCVHWGYSNAVYRDGTVIELAEHCMATLQRLIEHCVAGEGDGGFVPGDFPQMEGIGVDELDALLGDL